MNAFSDTDRAHMQRALRLGRRGLGNTGDNPAVGCAIVKDGVVAGLGWTQPGGRPHAEAHALEMAGASAHGATAYVTLEPCAHRGRGAPCADALIEAGISRVVAAVQDPDPRTNGRGLARLAEAGVATALGLCAEEARRELSGFLKRVRYGRPFVTLKLAVSRDGKIAGGPLQRTAITGEAVRRRVHLLRAQSEGVLIGLSTALIDDPELTCRLPGLERRSPVRIVADSRTSIPPHLKLMQTASEVPVWLLTTRKEQADPGVTIIDCRATAEGWIDLADALRRLAAKGIANLLVEGGAHIARSFLEAKLVDRICLFQAPHDIGPDGIDALAGLPLAYLDTDYELIAREAVGSDRFVLYEAREKDL